jgi:hypothetical protein
MMRLLSAALFATLLRGRALPPRAGEVRRLRELAALSRR